MNFPESLTFDDVLLVPARSAVLPAETDTGTRVTRVETDAVHLAGAKPIGLPMDDEGVLPDALEHSARETGARLVILTPTIHSPTTATMSLKRRRAIASIIQALDMVLVEDDVYGYIPKRRPLPIALPMCQLGRVRWRRRS